MGRPRTIDDERILEAARQVFLEHGMGASTAKIAEDLGISHALLFQRFGTKEQLFRAAFRAPQRSDWEALIVRGADPDDLKGQLEHLSFAIYEELKKLIPRMALIRSSGLDVTELSDDGHEAPPLRARRLVAGWLKDARAKRLIRNCRPEHLADILLGALQSRPFMQHISGQKFPERDSKTYVLTVVDLVWSAIAPEEE